MSKQIFWCNSRIPEEIMSIGVRDLFKFNQDLSKSSIFGGDENIISNPDTNKQEVWRKSKNCWIPSMHWMGGFVWHYITLANNHNFHFDITCIENHSMQYTVYEKGSFYNWHMDGGTEFTIETSTGSQPWDNPKKLIDDNILKNNNLVRKLSFVVQLTPSNEYEGGELQIDTGNGTFTGSKEQGAIIFFDSRTRHRVTEITNGVRRSLVGWVVGPEWK